MNVKCLVLAGWSALILGVGAALAGPCDTSGRAANLKDAGSGPASTGQTTGMGTDTSQHPPTSTMNRAAGGVATSSQDAQRQMHGKPTAAEQAQGARSEPQTAQTDKGC
jgi:hypothetical protein